MLLTNYSHYDDREEEEDGGRRGVMTKMLVTPI